MKKGRIASSQDCEDSEFSSYDKEEEVRSVEHVVDITGNEFGGSLEISDRPFVTLDGAIKGTSKEYEVKAEIERCLGPFVTYLWNGSEAKSEKIAQRNKRHVECGAKQQVLASYNI